MKSAKVIDLLDDGSLRTAYDPHLRAEPPLDLVCAYIRRFVSLSEPQARVVSLWTIHTHLLAVRDATPYLAITSQEKQSGKTRLLEVCETLVASPWMTGRVTAAVLTRKIDKEAPTLLLDESDAAFGGEKEYAEALRGILNTGHRRGGKASCCVGQGVNITFKDFSTYCPKAIAGIGRLPDTVADRAIPIRLKRAAPGEIIERFRLRDIRAEADTRVNIFRQRSTLAIVMRVIPQTIPDFATLNLPPQLGEAANLRNGIVLVTGPTGSGKSSTLAAILNKINEEKAYHILTIEDPIEVLHLHKKSTIHQRELHSDTPSFSLALRAALRQAPKVILVGEMRDRETIEIALEAAETGHLVFSTLHTVDAAKTIERIIGAFPLSDQQAICHRVSKAFRFIISQRLIPRKDGTGRVAAIEILKSTMRTREYVEKGEGEGKSLIDAMRDGGNDGMQYFDGELERMIRAGIIDLETGLGYASNAGNLRLELADFVEAAATPIS